MGGKVAGQSLMGKAHGWALVACWTLAVTASAVAESRDPPLPAVRMGPPRPGTAAPPPAAQRPGATLQKPVPLVVPPRPVWVPEPVLPLTPTTPPPTPTLKADGAATKPTADPGPPTRNGPPPTPGLLPVSATQDQLAGPELVPASVSEKQPEQPPSAEPLGTSSRPPGPQPGTIAPGSTPPRAAANLAGRPGQRAPDRQPGTERADPAYTDCMREPELPGSDTGPDRGRANPSGGRRPTVGPGLPAQTNEPPLHPRRPRPR